MATGLGLEDRAVRYLTAAAEVATARFADSDAGELLERAADLAASPSERDRLTLGAAQAYVRAGRFDRARPLSEAVAIAGGPGVRLEAALLFEEACRMGVGALRAAELLRAALERAALDEHAPARVHATASLGRSLIFADRFLEGQRLVDSALVEARKIADPRLLLAVLDAASFELLLLRPGQGLERLHRYRRQATEAMSLARELGDLDKLGSAAQAQHYVAYVLGASHLYHSSLEALEGVARTTHSPFWRFRTEILMASRHLVAGDLRAARASLTEGERRAVSLGHTLDQMEGPLSMQSFVIRREAGGLEFARPLLASTTVAKHPWKPGLVAMYRELGLTEPARTELRHTVGHDLEDLRSNETWPASLALLGDAAVWLADGPAAEQLLAEAEPFTGLNLSAAELLAPFGSADRLIGGLESVLGVRSAEDHFAAALEMDLAMEAPLHVATTHAEWAAHLRRSGAPERRVEQQERAARELADRYGLVRVQGLLQVEGGANAQESPGGLTAREVEVLRLVGRGHSNRDIAAELFISEHTAANHVRSILQKTQATNRTAAARYAQVHGLLGDDSAHGFHGGT